MLPGLAIAGLEMPFDPSPAILDLATHYPLFDPESRNMPNVELGLVVAKAGSDGMLLSRSTKRLTDRISIMKGDETFFLLFPMQVSRV